jgi:outer membrane lipoprotein SlyB
MAQLVYGLFNDSDDADRAIRDLTALGYAPADLTVVMSDRTRERVLAGVNIEDFGRKAASGAGIGAAAVGLLAGAATGVALLAGIVIAGPLAAVAAAIAAGAAGGAVIGALAGAGLPPEQHADVQRAIDSGEILIAVQADGDRAARVRAVLQGSEDDAPGA